MIHCKYNFLVIYSVNSFIYDLQSTYIHKVYINFERILVDITEMENLNRLEEIRSLLDVFKEVDVRVDEIHFEY